GILCSDGDVERVERSVEIEDHLVEGDLADLVHRDEKILILRGSDRSFAREQPLQIVIAPVMVFRDVARGIQRRKRRRRLVCHNNFPAVACWSISSIPVQKSRTASAIVRAPATASSNRAGLRDSTSIVMSTASRP